MKLNHSFRSVLSNLVANRHMWRQAQFLEVLCMSKILGIRPQLNFFMLLYAKDKNIDKSPF